jgi:hypothetical protein
VLSSRATTVIPQPVGRPTAGIGLAGARLAWPWLWQTAHVSFPHRPVDAVLEHEPCRPDHPPVEARCPRRLKLPRVSGGLTRRLTVASSRFGSWLAPGQRHERVDRRAEQAQSEDGAGKGPLGREAPSCEGHRARPYPASIMSWTTTRGGRLVTPLLHTLLVPAPRGQSARNVLATINLRTACGRPSRDRWQGCLSSGQRSRPSQRAERSPCRNRPDRVRSLPLAGALRSPALRPPAAQVAQPDLRAGGGFAW